MEIQKELVQAAVLVYQAHDLYGVSAMVLRPENPAGIVQAPTLELYLTTGVALRCVAQLQTDVLNVLQALNVSHRVLLDFKPYAAWNLEETPAGSHIFHNLIYVINGRQRTRNPETGEWVISEKV